MITIGVVDVVCDDSFGLAEAVVACKSVGFSDAFAGAVEVISNGIGTGVIYMDDVRCNGTEHSLDECSYLYSTSTSQAHNCLTTEAAGVDCLKHTFQPPPTRDRYFAVPFRFRMPRYSECEVTCATNGGWLASIRSDSEQKLVTKALNGRSAVIGANRFAGEHRSWRWEGRAPGVASSDSDIFRMGPKWDAPAVGFSNWENLQPNNMQEIQAVALARPSGKWFDAEDGANDALCMCERHEIDPPPTPSQPLPSKTASGSTQGLDLESKERGGIWTSPSNAAISSLFGYNVSYCNDKAAASACRRRFHENGSTPSCEIVNWCTFRRLSWNATVDSASSRSFNGVFDPWQHASVLGGAAIDWPAVLLFKADLDAPGSVTHPGQAVSYEYVEEDGEMSVLWNVEHVHIRDASTEWTPWLTAQAQIYRNGTIVLRYFLVPNWAEINASRPSVGLGIRGGKHIIMLDVPTALKKSYFPESLSIYAIRIEQTPPNAFHRSSDVCWKCLLQGNDCVGCGQPQPEGAGQGHCLPRNISRNFCRANKTDSEVYNVFPGGSYNWLWAAGPEAPTIFHQGVFDSSCGAACSWGLPSQSFSRDAVFIRSDGFWNDCIGGDCAARRVGCLCEHLVFNANDDSSSETLSVAAFFASHKWKFIGAGLGAAAILLIFVGAKFLLRNRLQCENELRPVPSSAEMNPLKPPSDSESSLDGVFTVDRILKEKEQQAIQGQRTLVAEEYHYRVAIIVPEEEMERYTIETQMVREEAQFTLLSLLIARRQGERRERRRLSDQEEEQRIAVEIESICFFAMISVCEKLQRLVIRQTEIRNKTAAEELEEFRQLLFLQVEDCENVERWRLGHAMRRSSLTIRPSYWSSDGNARVVELPANNEIGMNVAQLMKKSNDRKRRFEIASVARIENRRVFEQYALYRLQVEERILLSRNLQHHTQQTMATSQLTGLVAQLQLNSGANECLGWHGTRGRHCMDIVNHGFDNRVSNEGNYGSGVYFADLSTKADRYAHADESGTHYMFLARVVIGVPFAADPGVSYQSLRRPPRSTDSVIGVIAEHYREFVVYGGAHCYPEFLVKYHHLE